jgi:hypothetical protein
MRQAAENEGITVMGTGKNQFTAGAQAAKALGVV